MTLIGVLEVVAFDCALAEPPLQRGAALLGHEPAFLGHEPMPGHMAALGGESKIPTTAISTTAGPQPPQAHLDLRVPVDSRASDIMESAGPDRHRLFSHEESESAGQQTRSPAVSLPSGHIASPMETMVHNFRQEGLPIAKLFQSSNSLVHVGLNPKGKPGLWLVHKLH